MKRKRGFMELKLFKLVLDKVQEAGISHIILHTVGEPLMHPKFLEMLKLSVLCPTIKKVEFYTNGSLLDETYMKEILNMKICRVYVSFSGWDKKSYETRYCGGVFEDIVKKLTMFNQMIRAYGAPLQTLMISGLVDEEWEKEKVIIFLKNIGLETSQVSLLHPFNWIGFILNSYNCSIDGHDNTKSKQRACYFIRDNPGILHDGKVTACGCHDINGELLIGDIQKQSISEIRKGAYFKEIVCKLKQGNLGGLVCHKCDAVERW